MPGARHQFAPPMTMQQPIDRTVIDGVPDALFKRAPDLLHRRDLPALSLGKKRSEEFLLFFQGKILPSSASLTWCFNRCNAETIVAGDYRMNGCFGDATVPRNLCGRPWLDEGIVDNEPALSPVGARISSHPVFHLCKRQMGGCMGCSRHVFFSSRHHTCLESTEQPHLEIVKFPGALSASSCPSALSF